MLLKIEVTLKPGLGGIKMAPDMLMKAAFPTVPIEVEFNADLTLAGPDEEDARIFNFSVGGVLYGQLLDHPDPDATVDHLESLPSVMQGLFVAFIEIVGEIYDDLEAKHLELDHSVTAGTEMDLPEHVAQRIIEELHKIKTSGRLSTM